MAMLPPHALAIWRASSQDQHSLRCGGTGWEELGWCKAVAQGCDPQHPCPSWAQCSWQSLAWKTIFNLKHTVR